MPPWPRHPDPRARIAGDDRFQTITEIDGDGASDDRPQQVEVSPVRKFEPDRGAKRRYDLGHTWEIYAVLTAGSVARLHAAARARAGPLHQREGVVYLAGMRRTSPPSTDER